MRQVTVLDYGAGNLLNVVRALQHCGATVTVTQSAADILAAERLVFPGVGAFGDCMQALDRMQVAAALKEYILSQRLFLGICVGMQVLFDAGEEFGEHAGLGIIPGRVVKIPAIGSDGTMHKIPHIGWNLLQRPEALASWQGTLLAPMEGSPERSVYFVHSYAGIATDPNHVLATTQYHCLPLCAAVHRYRATGVQFHPEKSGETGLELIREFLKS
jgi:glutamine amidotransferase